MFVRNPCTHDARVLKEAATLARNGYDVTVVALSARGLPEREERGGFRIVRIDLGPSRSAATRSRSRSGLVTVAQAALVLLGYTRRALAAAAERPADVFHAHDLGTLWPAYRAARRYGGRLVYDSHELSLEAGRAARIRGPAKAALRAFERHLIRRADAVITVNGSIARLLERRYGIPRPAVVMNCPPTVELDADGDALRRAAAVAERTPIVLYQGGLTADRGLPALVRGFVDVPDAALVFLGEGPLRADLERLATDLGLAGRVRFLEMVAPQELLRYTQGAAVGVVPYQDVSLNNRLASPNKLFEYLMAAVPVAVSDLPEMSAIVKEGAVGAVFDPEDPGDIARSIREVLRPERQADLRARARRLATETYSWERQAEVLLRVYASLGLTAVR